MRPDQQRAAARLSTCTVELAQRKASSGLCGSWVAKRRQRQVRAVEGAESGQEQVPPACPPHAGGDACSLIPSLCESVLLSRLRTSQLNCLAVLSGSTTLPFSQAGSPIPIPGVRPGSFLPHLVSPTPPFPLPPSAGLHDHAAVPRTFHTHRQVHRNTFHGSLPKAPLPQGNTSSPGTWCCLRADFQSGPWFPASKSGLHLDTPPHFKAPSSPRDPLGDTLGAATVAGGPQSRGPSLALGSERAGPGLGLQPLKGRP